MGRIHSSEEDEMRSFIIELKQFKKKKKLNNLSGNEILNKIINKILNKIFFY